MTSENRNIGAECSTKTENKFFINEYFQDGNWLQIQRECFLSEADAIRCRLTLTNSRGDRLEIRTVRVLIAKTLTRELSGKSYEDLIHELYEKDMEVEDLKMQIDYWKGKVCDDLSVYVEKLKADLATAEDTIVTLAKDLENAEDTMAMMANDISASQT